MEKYFGSKLENKLRHLYFGTWRNEVVDGTETGSLVEDTIIIFGAYTPTNRISKYWFIIRFNGNVYRNGITAKDLKTKKTILQMNDMKKSLPKGYTLTKPYLYSGRFENLKC